MLGSKCWIFFIGIGSVSILNFALEKKEINIFVFNLIILAFYCLFLFSKE